MPIKVRLTKHKSNKLKKIIIKFELENKKLKEEIFSLRQEFHEFRKNYLEFQKEDFVCEIQQLISNDFDIQLEELKQYISAIDSDLRKFIQKIFNGLEEFKKEAKQETDFVNIELSKCEEREKRTKTELNLLIQQLSLELQQFKTGTMKQVDAVVHKRELLFLSPKNYKTATGYVKKTIMTDAHTQHRASTPPPRCKH